MGRGWGRRYGAGWLRGARLAAAPPALRDEEGAAAAPPGRPGCWAPGAGAAESGAGLHPPEGLLRRGRAAPAHAERPPWPRPFPRLLPEGNAGPPPALPPPRTSRVAGVSPQSPGKGLPSLSAALTGTTTVPGGGGRVWGSCGAQPSNAGTASRVWGSPQAPLVVSGKPPMGERRGEVKASRACDGGCLMGVVVGTEGSV